MKKAAKTHAFPPAPPAPPPRRVSIADDEEGAQLEKRQLEEDVGEMARRAAAIFSSTLARTSLYEMLRRVSSSDRWPGREHRQSGSLAFLRILDP